MPNMQDLLSPYQDAADIAAAEKAKADNEKESAESVKAARAAADAAMAAAIKETGPFATIAADKLSVCLWECDGSGVKSTKYPTAEAVPAPTSKKAPAKKDPGKSDPSKPDPKPVPKPAPWYDPKPESKPDPKPEPDPQPKPEPVKPVRRNDRW